MLEPHCSSIAAFRGTEVATSSMAIEDDSINGVADIGTARVMFEGPGEIRCRGVEFVLVQLPCPGNR